MTALNRVEARVNGQDPDKPDDKKHDDEERSEPKDENDPGSLSQVTKQRRTEKRKG